MEVKVNLDLAKTPDLSPFAVRVEGTVALWYPYIADFLTSANFTPPQKIEIFLETGMKFGPFEAAYVTDDGIIIGNMDYYRANPHDIGSIIHEVTHIVQQYPSNETTSCPWWLTEGIADYVRYYKFERFDDWPLKPTLEQLYSDGYEVTAFFINYVVQQVREDIVYWINMACREGRYDQNHTIWINLTGKTLVDLWIDMLRYE